MGKGQNGKEKGDLEGLGNRTNFTYTVHIFKQSNCKSWGRP